VSVSVLTNTLPAEKASHAIGLAYGIAGLGNAAGPLVGGLLTQTLGWRAVFWLLVPLAAAAFVIGMKSIPETSDETVPRRVDLSGLALITLGIGLFTFAFDRAPDSSYHSVLWICVATARRQRSRQLRGCATDCPHHWLIRPFTLSALHAPLDGVNVIGSAKPG
jgi:MFS family permease